MSDLTARIMEVVARLKGVTPAPLHAQDQPVGDGTAGLLDGVLDGVHADRLESDPPDLTRVLGLPLADLDVCLRISVPWLDVPLWFVPDEADAEALVAAGEATRGAVWTRQELLDLLAIPLTRAQAWTVALAKLELGGEVAEVWPAGSPPRRGWSDWPAALPGLGPCRVEAFDRCGDCGAASWCRYGDRVCCLPCARHRAQEAGA